eukprot:TRINITY_DN19420_c0_g1_i1.p1 TRINITY_DN19420_c0_g1~~TRINITY_DN19420_c0_g1_i1.p1  ORF type:complete len:561 (+),score=133.70 TRINITY_DN19420_c0_g1_i1:116-1798(+)
MSREHLAEAAASEDAEVRSEESDSSSSRSSSRSRNGQETAGRSSDSDLTDLFGDLRRHLGDDDFRNFLIQLSGEGPRTVAYHPDKSLHKELFDPEQWRRWIDPDLLAFLGSWHEKEGEDRDFSCLDLESFPGCRVEAPGVVSFPALTDEFCDLLLEEMKHYHQSGLPNRPPNSMNNYGLVLNEIGLKPVFSRLLREAFLPLGAKLFGSDGDRARFIKGIEVGGENWGGSSLNDHHTFVVQYRPSDDKHLDMHIDECDVTFNFGITPESSFEGNDLTFCGMFDSESHRKFHHTYKHIKGRCVVHSGKRRHGALDIEKGERASLIMWTKSQTFRRTSEYRERYNLDNWNLGSGPDRVCLSYTHDEDYKDLTPESLQFHMKPLLVQETASAAAEEREAVQTQKVWVRVCSDAELLEGTSQTLTLEQENKHVAVFRHRGKLFAMDNRCSHMGAPLCDGDIEDLAVRLKRSGLELGSDGQLEDGVVRCPRHGMCFNLRTGENIKGGRMKQKTYNVRLANEGRDIEVEVELEAREEKMKAVEATGGRGLKRPFAWLASVFCRSRNH